MIAAYGNYRYGCEGFQSNFQGLGIAGRLDKSLRWTTSQVGLLCRSWSMLLLKTLSAMPRHGVSLALAQAQFTEAGLFVLRSPFENRGVSIMTRFDHSSGHCLKVDEASIYFEIAGNHEGMPLVLLHGGLGSMADFNGLLGMLPTEYRVIGIDFRGHGRSTLGSTPLTYQRFQADVEAVLAHLGMAACTVLGFSDGGIVAYRMAAQSPSKVQALVTLGAQWRLEPDDPAFSMLSGLTPEMWMEMFPDSVSYYNSINPSPDFHALVKAAVSLWTDTRSSGYPNESMARITAPMLIVRGDHDHFLSLGEVVELRKRVQGAHFLNVPFAGHEAHKDCPTLFLSAVMDFMERTRVLPEHV